MNFNMKISSIVNLTTNVELLKLNKERNIEVVEFNKHSIVFQVPAEFPILRSSILLSGIILIDGTESNFQFTGKITSCEVTEKQTRVACDLLQYDRNLWQSCLTFLKKNQERADRLFIAIKGEKS